MNDLLWTLAAVVCILALRLFVLSLARVKGSSMLSTLHDGDWLLVWRLPYRFRAPRRTEVVICHYPGRYWKKIPFLPMSFVKRVMALPGETLEIIEGQTHINGTPVAEPFLDPAHTRFRRTLTPRTIPGGQFFVMGDNRDSSNDSRGVGPLRRRAIRGRAVCILWPPRHFGRIR